MAALWPLRVDLQCVRNERNIALQLDVQIKVGTSVPNWNVTKTPPDKVSCVGVIANTFLVFERRFLPVFGCKPTGIVGNKIVILSADLSVTLQHFLTAQKQELCVTAASRAVAMATSDVMLYPAAVSDGQDLHSVGKAEL